MEITIEVSFDGSVEMLFRQILESIYMLLKRRIVTKMSISKVSMIFRIASWQKEASATSPDTIMHLRPSFRPLSALLLHLRAHQDKARQRRRSRANRTATLRPIPESPPVTIATLSFSFLEPM